MTTKHSQKRLSDKSFKKRAVTLGLFFCISTFAALALLFTLSQSSNETLAQTTQTKISIIDKNRPTQAYIVAHPKGETVTAEIKLADFIDPDGLAAFSFKLTYDANLINIPDTNNDWKADTNTITLGSFLGSTGKKTQCADGYIYLDETTNSKWLSYSCVTLGSTPAGPTGSGTLATINFKTENKLGRGTLTLTKTQLIDNTINTNLVPHIVSSIPIQILKCADVSGPYGNPDGRVDLPNDIMGVSQRYGSRSTDPNWNPKYDLNDDGKVDLANDIMGASMQYAMLCTQ